MANKVEYLYVNETTGKKSNKYRTAIEWFNDGYKVAIMRNGQCVANWN